jgi:dienelactone hydrolase
MNRQLLLATLAPALALGPLRAADIQSNYWYQSTITTDANGPLDLLAELNYDDAQANAPIAVVMHGYSPATGNLSGLRPNAQRLRDNGFFVISVAMRGRDGSDGVRDSGGLEIHDIYDAVEAVKAGPQFAGLIDPGNIHITGYSGGGGNTMSALTKFPDYFRVGAAFFGMSDYGYDPANCWYNNGADSSHQSIMNNDVGNPNTGGNRVLDKYLARASNLASKNNPYSEIHLFVNRSETTCPPVNDTSYRDHAVAAESFAGEFDNITVHIGGTGAYEDFNGNSVNDANELQSWPHMFPTVNHQDAGELWYRDRLLAGTIPQPVLNDSDELQVAGFVKTAKFDCWLGDGQNAAGTLSYSLSDTLMSFSLALLTSDLRVTGDLSIDTARMAGREVRVELNDEPVSTFSGGGTFEFSGLGHNDTLELIDTGGENTFSNWIAGFDVGGLDGLDEDPDGDGIQNGVENVFGTLPDTFSPNKLPGIQLTCGCFLG